VSRTLRELLNRLEEVKRQLSDMNRQSAFHKDLAQYWHAQYTYFGNLNNAPNLSPHYSLVEAGYNGSDWQLAMIRAKGSA
jgi:hypothetical protein